MQAVILAGGNCKSLAPLTYGTLNALLPVANKPLLSYPLQLLSDANVKKVIVVAEGEVAESCLLSWMREYTEEHKDMRCEVVRVPEGSTLTDTLLAVAPKITSLNFLVLAGDVITEQPLLPIIGKHTMHGAQGTILLAPMRIPPSQLAKPSKIKGKTVIGLDRDRQLLLHYEPADPYVWFDKALFQWFPAIQFHNALVDGHVYILSRSVLRLLQDKVRSVAEEAGKGATPAPVELIPLLLQECMKGMQKLPKRKDATPEEEEEEGGEGRRPPHHMSVGSLGSEPASSFAESYADDERGGEEGRGAAVAELGLEEAKGAELQPRGEWNVFVHVLEGRYFQRVTSVEGYMEVNKEVSAVEHMHLAGLQPSKPHDNVVPSSVTFGNKATVGQGCILGEDVHLGDKANVKRSIIGSGCVLGTNVKVVNSVLMDDVEVADGCNIQGSVICTGASISTSCTLMSCQVRRGAKVAARTDAREEAI